MTLKRLTLTISTVFLYLILVNAFLFPFVFSEGIAEKFTNSRAESLPLFHVFALLATAILLTILVERMGPGSRPALKGAASGSLLGLLVALPEHLHLYAMVDAGFVRQFIPVPWILVTWGIAGAIVGMFQKYDSRLAG